MKAVHVAILSLALATFGCASATSAAGKYDGSKVMLCAVTAVNECTADGKCERSAPKSGNNLPAFLRVDVAGKVLTDNDGSGRKTEIKTLNAMDNLLMLQGVENGKAWSMVIGSDTGVWGGSVVEDDGMFALFGACTLP